MEYRIMIRNILICTLIFCCVNGVALAQEPGDSISQVVAAESDLTESATQGTSDLAAQAFRDKDYKESIALYEEIIAQGLQDMKVSAQLYYNLGNAYFRDNQLGKAILYYERALLLNPGDGDIRHNLKFAQNRTVDRIENTANLFLANWFNGVRNMYSSNQWAKIGILFFILFLACVGVYLFLNTLWARKSAFYAGILFFFLVITSNIFSFSQKKERIRRDTAIVMVGASTVNASPDANSSQLFELHEGTKVKIRNSDNNWYEIQIADGSVGWVKQQDVEVI